MRVKKQEEKKSHKKVLDRVATLCTWDNIDYPVFSYNKANKVLKEKLSDISHIITYIYKLQSAIDTLNTNLKECGRRINLFINNSFNIKPRFNYKKHFVIIDQDKIKVYNIRDILNGEFQSDLPFDYEVYDELYSLLPPTKKSFKASSKQRKTCDQLLADYMSYYEQVDMSMYNLKTAYTIYEEILDDVKEELSHVQVIDVTYSQAPEEFDEDIHNIVAVKNRNKIDFFYMRKEFKNNFMEQIIYD